MDGLDTELRELCQSEFSKGYVKNRIRHFNTPITERRNKFENPEQIFYHSKRYKDCIMYIQSLKNYYSDHYITYLIKANNKMGNSSSARAVTNLYTSSRSCKEEKDRTMRLLNDVFEKTHIDEFYIAEELSHSHLKVPEGPSYIYDKAGCMIASRDIMMGKTILIETPLFSGGNTKCAHCFHDSALSKCCVKCKSVYYCSEDCQSNQTIHQCLCKLCEHQETAPYALMAFHLVFEMEPTQIVPFEGRIRFNNIFNGELISKSVIKDLLKTTCELVAYALAEIKEESSYEQFKNIFLEKVSWNTTDYSFYHTFTTLGPIMLRVLIFCKYKSVLIFDNVLGTSNEFYSTLIYDNINDKKLFSRTGDKIVLKASREIEKGEEIYCSYFDMVENTTFLDVLLNNEVAVSTLRENCELVCKCSNRPLNCLSTTTNNLDDNWKIKKVPVDVKCLLQMVISNTRMYLKSRDPELLYSTFKTANEFILNKDHLLLQGIYFKVIKHEIGLENFGNVHQHLTIVMNTEHIQFFKRSHAEISSALLHRAKSVRKLPLSLLEVLRNYWKFIEEDVCPRYPNEMLLDIVEAMKPYMLAGDLDSLNEVFPMKASVA